MTAPRKLTCNGITHTLPEWEQLTGVSRETVRKRLQAGWDTEKALYTPVDPVRAQRAAKNDYKTKKCRKCRYHGTTSGAYVYCDYMSVKWDEEGKPQRRPCPAGWDCTAFEPKRRKQVRREWRLPSK